MLFTLQSAPLLKHWPPLTEAQNLQGHLSRSWEPSDPHTTHTCRDRFPARDYHSPIWNIVRLWTTPTHWQMLPLLCQYHAFGAVHMDPSFYLFPFPRWTIFIRDICLQITLCPCIDKIHSTDGNRHRSQQGHRLVHDVVERLITFLWYSTRHVIHVDERPPAHAN